MGTVLFVRRTKHGFQVSSVLEQDRKKFSSDVACVPLDIAFSELTLRLRIYISIGTEITTTRYRCVQKEIRNLHVRRNLGRI